MVLDEWTVYKILNGKPPKVEMIPYEHFANSVATINFQEIGLDGGRFTDENNPIALVAEVLMLIC